MVGLKGTACKLAQLADCYGPFPCMQLTLPQDQARVGAAGASPVIPGAAVSEGRGQDAARSCSYSSPQATQTGPDMPRHLGHACYPQPSLAPLLDQGTTTHVQPGTGPQR